MDIFIIKLLLIIYTDSNIPNIKQYNILIYYNYNKYILIFY